MPCINNCISTYKQSLPVRKFRFTCDVDLYKLLHYTYLLISLTDQEAGRLETMSHHLAMTRLSFSAESSGRLVYASRNSGPSASRSRSPRITPWNDTNKWRITLSHVFLSQLRTWSRDVDMWETHFYFFVKTIDFFTNLKYLIHGTDLVLHAFSIKSFKFNNNNDNDDDDNNNNNNNNTV